MKRRRIWIEFLLILISSRQLWAEPGQVGQVVTPSAVQASELQALEAQLGSEVHYELNDAGSLHYLSALDIAPGCSSPVVASPIDAEGVVDCFVGLYPGLFAEGSEDTRVVPRAIDRVGLVANDGFQSIRLHQLYGSVRVKHSEGVLVLRNGAPFSYMGRLFPPSLVPSPAAMASEEDVLAAAEAATASDLREVDRYFDPARGSV